MNDLNTAYYRRPQRLPLPKAVDAVLMHSCCAPCAGEVMQAVAATGMQQHILFYNPNIHPRREYEMRKDENKRYCEQLQIEFTDLDYDTDNWFSRVKGQEWEAERGARCTSCFDMRFERTALFAHEHGYRLICSTLGISRWKNMQQINDCGVRAAEPYDEIDYWTFNWRKQGGSARMVEIAKLQQFYQQEYCGCVYSLRDTNAHRAKMGRAPIRRGIKFYGKDGLV